MNEVTLAAYAKINMYLDVVSKREDGYHNIESVMQTVSLCDTVTLRVDNGEGIFLDCSERRLPCDDRNLAYRAAKGYLDAAKICAKVEIKIEKNIPFEAGLGGGSADAAAVLRAMNALFNEKLTMEELLSVGLNIGADVPFCIYGGTAKVRGVGELVSPLNCPPDYFVVIAIDGEGVSTPKAFGLLDELHGNYIERDSKNSEQFENICHCYETSDIDAVIENAYNAFEDAIFEIRPRAKEIRDLLTDNGADAAVLSGSGPSVIGIFKDFSKAERAVKVLRDGKVSAWLTYPVKY